MDRTVASEKRRRRVQGEATQNKADGPLASLQRENQSRKDKQKDSRVEALHSLGYFEKEIAQDSQIIRA